MTALATYCGNNFLTPIDFRTYFRKLGDFMLVMASVFLFIGLMPSRVTQKPKYSISVCHKKDFSIFHWSPFSFKLLSINSNFCTWSVQYPFVKTKSSSMYAQINSNPWNKLFSFCWKMSGKLLTPIGRCLYRYFPHGIIIVHKLLAF